MALTDKLKNITTKAKTDLRNVAYVGLGLILGTGANVIANAIIETEVPEYISPGNNYVMQITADNTGLLPDGEKTRGIQWSFFNIPSYINVTEARVPSSNDFFQGFSMDNVVAVEGLSGRAGLNYDGPANKQGVVAEYDFNINGYSGEMGVQGKFELKKVNTKFYDLDSVEQSRTVIDNSFTIVPEGDFDGDGDVDGVDFGLWQVGYPTASGASLGSGDADQDGDVDGVDFGIWQAAYPTAAPSAMTYKATVPEPSTLGLIALGAAGAATVSGNRRKRRANGNRNRARK